MACTCRALRDIVYDHNELWPNLSAVGAASDADGTTPSPFDDTLAWAQARGRVRRLRAHITPHTARGGRYLAGTPANADAAPWIGRSFRSLTRCVGRLDRLVSLHVCLEVGPSSGASPAPGDGARAVAALVAAAPATLRQLTLRVPDLHLPAAASRLTALTALVLDSPDAGGAALSGGVRISLAALPAGLRRLAVGSLAAPELPRALTGVSALESLSLDWAGDAAAESPAAPDFSLLEAPAAAGWATGHLTALSLGYFAAAALPKALPPTLRSLELQWNYVACEPASRKDGFRVEDFHASFSCLGPLTEMTHLCLNRALGGWGLPPAVARLSQLRSLGVAGADPGEVASLQGPARPPGTLAAQVAAAFPRLTSLDIEILDAAAGWEELATLGELARLRLGRGGQPETYVQPAVHASLGRGLVRLLPALPALKEVHTEGMLLPATAACARWARLAGFDAPELRGEAEAAVEAMHRRGVALARWYSGAASPAREGMETWDEVE